MAEPFRMPTGVTVETVDWLPSGARSGLVRVRGRGTPGELPLLVLGDERFASLPDTRSEREPGAWRGAYVVDVAHAAAARRWALEWPGGLLAPLDAPDVQPARAAVEPEAPEPAGGEVVDRAVLAERRARRAEAAEAAQARIAREALRAVEVLELRAAEVEERLAAIQAERDALLARPAPEPAAVVSEPEPEPAPSPEPPPAASDPARLREALVATIAVVADLRLQLHEAQLARRSREVAWSADAVKLTVLTREHAALKATLEAAESELVAARAAAVTAAAGLEEARAATAGAEAAHDETRRRFTERVAELGTARERIATLEAEVAAVRAEAERAAAEAADAVRAEARMTADARVADAEADAAARVADAEAVAHAALDRAVRAEEAVADALLAREIAEAAAAAAHAERRAAAVRHAAEAPAPLSIPRQAPPAVGLSGALGAAASRLRDETPPRPVPVPDEVAARAAEQVERAGAAEPAARVDVAARLDDAAEGLRRRATIVSAPTDPPGDLARGRGARDYPPLRGALVKLAHDDPAAAAKLVAGLLPGAPAVTGERSFDVTLDCAGVYAVAGGDVTRLERPRGRPHAAFHLRADGVTAAELLAGVGPKPGRRGRAKTSGRVRHARAAVRDAAAAPVGLRELLDAGARPDPLLALQALAYAVHPSQTAGQGWCVEVTGADGAAVYACADDHGLQVRPDAPQGGAGARLRLGEDGVAAVLGDDALDADGDLAAVAALRGLALAAAGA